MIEVLTGITQALRTVSTNVYFLHLPDEETLNEHSIVYTLTNTANDPVLEQREHIKTYDLIVRINSAKLSTDQIGGDELNRVLNLVQPIKNIVYQLPYNAIYLTDEDNLYDDNLDIYTYILRFEITIAF